MLKFFRSLKFKFLALAVSIASSFQFVALAKLDVKIESFNKPTTEQEKICNDTTLTLQYDDNIDEDKREFAAYALLALLNRGFKKNSNGKIISYNFEKNNFEGSKFVINSDSGEMAFLLNFLSSLLNFFSENNNNINKHYLYDAIFNGSYEFKSITEYFESKKEYFKDFLKQNTAAKNFISSSSVDVLRDMLKKVQDVDSGFPKISNFKQGEESTSIGELLEDLNFVTSSEKKKSSEFCFEEGLLKNDFNEVKADLFNIKDEKGEESSKNFLGKKKKDASDGGVLENEYGEDPYIEIADILKEVVSIDSLNNIVEKRKELFGKKSLKEQNKEIVEKAKEVFEKKQINNSSI